MKLLIFLRQLLPLLAGTAIVAATSMPQLVNAAIPSGQWRIQVSDATNHVWDVTLISQLQSPVAEFVDDDTTVAFDAPFGQSGSGKLSGKGSNEIHVASSILIGTVPGSYVAKGSIGSAKGLARLNFSSSVRGLANIEGRPRLISSSVAVKVAIDSITESVTGTYASTAAAAGYGALKESGTIDFPWGDLAASMGNGAWILRLNLTNDTVKKVGGTASVVISGGGSLGFTAKGNYNAKTDSTLLILTADAESKGSSLKLTWHGSGTATLQGKLTGQTIKAFGTLEPD